MRYLLALDQGTSSTRALLFETDGKLIGLSQLAITQSYPRIGWVEHNPEEIWQKTHTVAQAVLSKSSVCAKDVMALGLTNQRETVVIWNRRSGEVLGPAIVWQDRRTADFCHTHKTDEPEILERTGLCLDPYFSASKIKWMLDNYPHARELANKVELAFGTIDSFLIWRLTGGKKHLTDITNASRTMLYNINNLEWDSELLDYFDIPRSLLPEVCGCAGNFGETAFGVFDFPVMITGVAGDQQAALIGQACVKPKMTKVTYGTGAFLLLNTGKKKVSSRNKLLSTICYQINDELCYGLEGSIFNAGTIVRWLRDSLGIINDPSDTETLAAAIPSNGGVYCVPAFTGLGSPHWQANARAQITGLQLDSDRRHFARAALESVAYQTHDVIHAMAADSDVSLKEIRVDGGMVVNNWLLQFIADTCNIIVERPTCIESTARGAAFLAALGAQFYQSLDDVTAMWQSQSVYQPSMETAARLRYYKGWQQAVKSCCDYNS